jgi:sortase A
MSTKTLKRGGLAIILLGFAFLVFPVITGWQTEKEQKALEKEWNSLNTSYQNPFQPQKATAADSDSKQKASDNTKKAALEQGVIGKMTIPKIDLSAMMVPGVTQKDLKNSLGWMKSTAYPGEAGNTVIAGHRSYTYGQFFHRLNEIENGDTIKIETTSGLLLYRVYEKTVVEPDDLSVLKAKKEEELTLITCEPLYSDKYRLIVKAERIN